MRIKKVFGQDKKGTRPLTPRDKSGSTQGKALAIRWLLAASRKRPGRNMAFKLSSELVDAAKGSGDAIRKREETHRMIVKYRLLVEPCELCESRILQIRESKSFIKRSWWKKM